jgi:transcriptional regulator with XRE-family HTH domain
MLVPVATPPQLDSAVIDQLLGELGRTVQAARLAKGLRIAAAARVCGISDTHLGEMEKGGSPSVKLLIKVAHGLGITSIRLGGDLVLDLSVVSGDQHPAVHLTSEEVERTVQHLVAAHELLTGKKIPPKDVTPADAFPLAAVVTFRPAAPLLSGSSDPALPAGFELVSDSADRVSVQVSATVSLGRSLGPASKDDIVMIPRAALERDEVVVRVVGNGFTEWEFKDGDQLVIERRQAFNNELVLAVHNGGAVIGRYWNKHGDLRLFGPDASHSLKIAEGDAFEVYGIITSKLRAL